MVTNKEVCAVFFENMSGNDRRCRCGKVYQQAPKSGYTNLMTHIKKSHPDYQAVAESALRENPAPAEGNAGKIDRPAAGGATGGAAGGASSTDGDGKDAKKNRACLAKHIVRYREVRALFVEHGDQVQSKWISDLLEEYGLTATSKHCQSAQKALLKEYETDRDQFELLLQDQESSLLSLEDLAAVAASTTEDNGGGAPGMQNPHMLRKREDAAATSAATTAASASTTGSRSTTHEKSMCTAKQITKFPAVRALFVQHGEKVKPAWIMKVLVKKGLTSTNVHCFNAKKKLLEKYVADPDAFVAEYNNDPASDAETASDDGDDEDESSFLIKRRSIDSGTPTPSSSNAKKSRFGGGVDSPASAVASVTIARSEVCSLTCDPVAVPPSQKTYIVEWKLREPSSVQTFFDLYGHNRRIEILRSGLYKVQLYLEPSEDSCEHDGDGVKYYLTVNNNPVTSFTDKSVRRLRQPQFSGNSSRAILSPEDHDRDDVRLGVFNVTEVQLEKWDMIVLKRRREDSNVNNNNDDHSERHTPFGRLIIEPLEG